jgi:ELWxxDGT repeat protein
MRKGPIAGLLFGLVLAMGPVRAEEVPHLLADINRTPRIPFSTPLHEEPSGFFELGGRLLFSTADFASLDQGILWSTDGTVAGTRQLSTSLCRSACKSITPIKVWQGVALLRIESGGSVLLGRTDGTTAGTFLLTGDFYKDYYETPLDVYLSSDAGSFYFQGCRQTEGCSLWRSDGTRAGTALVLGTDSLPFFEPHGFTLWRGRLYFLAVHGEAGMWGLWSIEGTQAEPRLIHRVTKPEGYPGRLAATPSHLFFTSGEAGEDLWVTGGSPADTRPVADFDPPTPDHFGPPDVNSMTASGDRVFFEIQRAGHSFEIWQSDGTAEGTRPLIELPARVLGAWNLQRVGRHWLFVAATVDSPPVLWTVDDGFTAAARLTGCDGGICPSLEPSALSTTAEPLLFAGFDSVHGSEPWVTDGTGPGTRLLADICPGSCGGISHSLDFPGDLRSPSGITYFRALSEAENYETGRDELWVTDGTSAGTHRVAGHFAGLGFLNGRAYFGSSGQGHPASELWSTDGTPGQDRRVAVLRRQEPGSAPAFQPFGNGALLVASKGSGRAALWRSDGTPQGTFQLDDFSQDNQTAFVYFLGPERSFQLLQVYRERFDFDPQARTEIWRTDGTPRGTRAIATFPPMDYMGEGISWDGKLLFVISSYPDYSFWSSDGTGVGTREILPLLPSAGNNPHGLVTIGPRFLFFTQVGTDDRPRSGLFISDGTAAGTLEVVRLAGYANLPVQIGGTVFFQITRNFSNQVWRTDGTPAGTRLALPLLDTADLQSVGGSLYLTADLSADPEGGRGLFRVSPSGGEPILLARISHYAGASLYSPLQLSQAGDRLFFTIQEIGRGFELWITDGTPAGTRRVRRFQPTPSEFRDPETLISTNGRTFFAASDGLRGRELWESDGTYEGTRIVADLAPGGFSSIPFPSSFGVANKFLFFAADDGRTGVEPWALRLAP